MSLSMGLLHQTPVYNSPVPIRATCTAHLILLDSINRIFDDKYKSYSSSFSSHPCYFALCRPNIFLSTLFPDTLSLRSSLNLRNQDSETQLNAHICLFIRRVVKSYKSCRVRFFLTLALNWCTLLGSLLAYRERILRCPVRSGLDWPQGRKKFWLPGKEICRTASKSGYKMKEIISILIQT